MSWRDRLRDASFRGVAFKVESNEAEFGRRQVVHTAALVDTPSLEDLGRAADVFNVEGYILGDDYDLQRDELIKAIRDTSGPGILVHPNYGEKNVGASGFRIRHENQNGRICRFVVTFGEAGGETQPTEITDAPNVLAADSTAISEASEETFVDKFKAAGLPQYVRDAASGSLETLGNYLAEPSAFIQSSFTDVQGVFGVVTETADAVSEVVSEYKQQVSDFLSEVTDLVNEPGDLASRVTDLISGIRTTFSTSEAGSMLAGLLSLFSRNSGSGGTPSRQQVIDNQNAVAGIVTQQAAAELAVIAVTKNYDTVEDAVNARDSVAEAIDKEAEITQSDSVYQALEQTRADLVMSLPPPEQSPTRVVPYITKSTLPALVISQTLYDNATRAESIVKRNMVRHPGFVAGGQTIEVLSDG